MRLRYVFVSGFDAQSLECNFGTALLRSVTQGHSQYAECNIKTDNRLRFEHLIGGSARTGGQA